jgi:hypothetical protein
MKEQIQNVIEAWEELRKDGNHEGPCTNLGENNVPDGPCFTHLKTFDERKNAMESAINELERVSRT